MLEVNWRMIGVVSSSVFSLLSFIGIVLVAAFNKYSHDKIVHNDLHHLSLDNQEIKNKINRSQEDISEIKKDVAVVKARVSILEKKV